MQTIRISLNDLSSLDAAVNTLSRLAESMEEKLKTFVKRLAEIGLDVAKAGFTSAAYTMGDNDVDVELEEDGTKCTIVANGSAVCFIEFGTGDGATHPYGAEHGFTPGSWSHGSYGKGFYPPGWTYNKKYTTGEPAAMAMYTAAQQMREQIQTIAREVFG